MAYGGKVFNQIAPNALPDKVSEPDHRVNKTLKPVSRDNANIEAEKGETAFILDKEGLPAHYKIGGKRHSKGGTPLNVPDDTFIFSDTKSMVIKDLNVLSQFGETKPKTPAKIAEKYDLNQYRKVLSDKHTDDLQRQTAEKMIENYTMILGKLALVQESMKGFPQGIPMIAQPYMIMNNIKPEDILPQPSDENAEESAEGQFSNPEEEMMESQQGMMQQPPMDQGMMPPMEGGPGMAYGGVSRNPFSYNPLQKYVYGSGGSTKRKVRILSLPNYAKGGSPIQPMTWTEFLDSMGVKDSNIRNYDPKKGLMYATEDDKYFFDWHNNSEYNRIGFGQRDENKKLKPVDYSSYANEYENYKNLKLDMLVDTYNSLFWDPKKQDYSGMNEEKYPDLQVPDGTSDTTVSDVRSMLLGRYGVPYDDSRTPQQTIDALLSESKKIGRMSNNDFVRHMSVVGKSGVNSYTEPVEFTSVYPKAEDMGYGDSQFTTPLFVDYANGKKYLNIDDDPWTNPEPRTFNIEFPDRNYDSSKGYIRWDDYQYFPKPTYNYQSLPVNYDEKGQPIMSASDFPGGVIQPNTYYDFPGSPSENIYNQKVKLNKISEQNIANLQRDLPEYTFGPWVYSGTGPTHNAYRDLWATDPNFFYSDRNQNKEIQPWCPTCSDVGGADFNADNDFLYMTYYPHDYSDPSQIERLIETQGEPDINYELRRIPTYMMDKGKAHQSGFTYRRINLADKANTDSKGADFYFKDYGTFGNRDFVFDDTDASYQKAPTSEYQLPQGYSWKRVPSTSTNNPLGYEEVMVPSYEVEEEVKPKFQQAPNFKIGGSTRRLSRYGNGGTKSSKDTYDYVQEWIKQYIDKANQKKFTKWIPPTILDPKLRTRYAEQDPRRPGTGYHIYGDPEVESNWEEFKQRHAWYFKDTLNKPDMTIEEFTKADPSDKKRAPGVKAFQKAYNAKAKEYGLPEYFNESGKGVQGTNVDGHYGEHTYSAPSFNKYEEPPAEIIPPVEEKDETYTIEPGADLETDVRPYTPYGWFPQDLINLGVAAGTAIPNIKTYYDPLKFRAPDYATIRENYSPILGAQRIGTEGATAYASKPAAFSMASALAGKSAEAAARHNEEVAKINAGKYDAWSAAVAGVDNENAKYNSLLRQADFDARQLYAKDRLMAKNKKFGTIGAAVNAGLTNAAEIYNLNAMNENFAIDPTTGGLVSYVNPRVFKADKDALMDSRIREFKMWQNSGLGLSTEQIISIIKGKEAGLYSDAMPYINPYDIYHPGIISSGIPTEEE
jgi:hypothetical protein